MAAKKKKAPAKNYLVWDQIESRLFYPHAQTKDQATALRDGLNRNYDSKTRFILIREK